jgi:hypothetical protein
MWQDAEQCRRLPIDIRIALLSANVHASTTAIEVIGTICDIFGSSIAPADSIFAACLRDARTLGGHIGVGGHKLELAAWMRFGLLEDSFAI